MFKYCRIFLTAAAFLILISGRACAQQASPKPGDYVASNIPDSLKKDANSVVRFCGVDVDVESSGDESIRFHQIITILNEKGDDQAVVKLPYNRKYDSYRDIEIKVYDSTGKAIGKYRKNDMYDGAEISEEDMVTDERFLGLKTTLNSYPETIEVQFEEKVASMLDLGKWEIQDDQQAVQYTYYHVSVDTSSGFRYKTGNTGIKPQINIADGKADYLWQVKNLKAFKLEEGAEPWRVLPALYFAQNKFNFYGVTGDFSSWTSFGKWISGLTASVNSLTPERAAEIKKMTDSIKTPLGKAKYLYKYMQQSMRYVSIQLGIGGLKPFPATFVDEKKYGDCKALSNYMSALLKAVGIKSYCAIVNAGPNGEPADPKFPFDYFDHEILCVPFQSDTTWLECTDQYQPFGQLGTFTENRNALIITEDGGKLVRTPRSTIAENGLQGTVDIKLDADGGAKASVKLAATGVYRDDYIGIAALKEDEQKEAFMRILNIKQPMAFDLTPDTDKNGIRNVSFRLTYDDFSDIKAGDKMFYRPHAFDLVAFTLPVEDHRKSDYYFGSPIKKTCVTTIELPNGFVVEALPASQDFKFAYGEYHVKYTYDTTANRVTSTTSFTITNQDIPAAQYNSLQQYLDNINSAQNKKLVIKRKA